MKQQVTSDNMEVTPAMISLAKEKLENLENRVKDVPEDLKSVRVVLNTAPDQTFEAKTEVTIAGDVYYANNIDFTLETALINSVADVERQLEKFKSIIEKRWEEQRETKRSLPEVMTEEES
jgi:ribosomal subunit interface protein